MKRREGGGGGKKERRRRKANSNYIKKSPHRAIWGHGVMLWYALK